MSALRRGWTVCLSALSNVLLAHNEGGLGGDRVRAVHGLLRVAGPVVGDIAVEVVVIVLEGRGRVLRGVVVRRCDGGGHGGCWSCVRMRVPVPAGKVYIVSASSIIRDCAAVPAQSSSGGAERSGSGESS